MDIIVRSAKREDCVQIRQLIQELANFENMPDSPEITAKTLEHDGFECERPPFKCLVVENKQNPGVLVGYALYNMGYTIGRGKSMYLEDIMVTEKFRGFGIGKQLFTRVCQEAAKSNCELINFVVLKWNNAVKFYENFGAEDVTKKSNLHYFAMQNDNIIEKARMYPG